MASERANAVGYAIGKGTRKTAQVVGKTGSTALSGTDQGIIVLSAIIVFGLGFLSSYVGPKKPNRGRLFVGVSILYIALAGMAEFNSKLARNFAILVMLTALLAEGGPVLSFLQQRAPGGLPKVPNPGPAFQPAAVVQPGAHPPAVPRVLPNNVPGITQKAFGAVPGL